ncbi:MAG: hypothetical protein JKY62_17000 [Desulfocapsa sp.]|nr:hypothetical protein [Desulfocapsa sp.]
MGTKLKVKDLTKIFQTLGESEIADVTIDPEDGSLHIDFVGDIPTIYLKPELEIELLD